MAENQDSIVALRTAQQHQVTLTVQADQKANINIGIVSLVVIFLTNSKLSIAAEVDLVIKSGLILFIATLGLSLIMALLVVVPRLGKTSKQSSTSMTNPFYFGSFKHVSHDDYVDYIDQHLQNNEQAKRMLASDTYQIGEVLDKKYRSLRISYLSLGLSLLLGIGLYSYALFSTLI